MLTYKPGNKRKYPLVMYTCMLDWYLSFVDGFTMVIHRTQKFHMDRDNLSSECDTEMPWSKPK